jgi:glycosyltransferase involved in cell wall biosynthesis
MKLAVLWPELSGYLNACLKAARDQGCDLFVAYRKPQDTAPFDPAVFAWIPATYPYDTAPDAHDLAARLDAFAPDAVLVSSWNIAPYRRVARRFRGRAVRILSMDNAWRGTLKQWLGVGAAPLFLHPVYDVAFVPGERQAEFARRLGFDDSRIWRGNLTCDHPAFAALWREGAVPPRRFLFVGRLAPEKGLSVLLDAYARYRAASADPWPLVVCGAGPLATRLAGVPGVDAPGFVQPEDLPVRFKEAGCLVLPSLFEPWGLVVHEAAAAGLAIISSTAAGAAVHLVQDGHNGYLVPPGDVAALARALGRYAAHDDTRRAEMAANSHRLSYQFTPAQWARTLRERTAEWRAG